MYLTSVEGDKQQEITMLLPKLLNLGSSTVGNQKRNKLLRSNYSTWVEILEIKGIELKQNRPKPFKPWVEVLAVFSIEIY